MPSPALLNAARISPSTTSDKFQSSPKHVRRQTAGCMQATDAAKGLSRQEPQHAGQSLSIAKVPSQAKPLNLGLRILRLHQAGGVDLTICNPLACCLLQLLARHSAWTHSRSMERAPMASPILMPSPGELALIRSHGSHALRTRESRPASRGTALGARRWCGPRWWWAGAGGLGGTWPRGNPGSQSAQALSSLPSVPKPLLWLLREVCAEAACGKNHGALLREVLASQGSRHRAESCYRSAYKPPRLASRRPRQSRPRCSSGASSPWPFGCKKQTLEMHH